MAQSPDSSPPADCSDFLRKDTREQSQNARKSTSPTTPGVAHSRVRTRQTPESQFSNDVIMANGTRDELGSCASGDFIENNSVIKA
ncbi:hypothetical protein JTB14_029761 [Gonioctena quinquepunctata]|nr:hypothetical protein JTB14_029761 [Gonioctena quinquepunctata]